MIPIPSPLVGPLVGAVVALLALAGAYWKGHSDADAAWEVQAKQSQIEALKTEAKWKAEIQTIRESQTNEKADIQSRLDTALGQLRNRPTVRLPDTSRAACAGSTGAELSKPDAVFLVGEAARADRLAADLRACEAYVNAVRRK